MLKRILKSWKLWLVALLAVASAYFYLSGNYLYLANRIGDLFLDLKFLLGKEGYINLAEEIEAVAGNDCLVVFPADKGEEEVNTWVNQYLDALLLEVVGEEHPSQGYEIFLLPPTDQPECVVALYRDDSGAEFLIYETAENPVKVPFTRSTGK